MKTRRKIGYKSRLPEPGKKPLSEKGNPSIQRRNPTINDGNHCVQQTEKQPDRQYCQLVAGLFPYALISCPFRKVKRMSSLA